MYTLVDIFAFGFSLMCLGSVLSLGTLAGKFINSLWLRTEELG